jgi:succinate dehydrogenase/fumarate reductase cytochrome b subunit
MKTTYFWILQVLTGMTVLVLSGIHMLSIHLGPIRRFFGAEAGAAAVPAYAGAWSAVLAAVSVVILVHAFIGLRQTMLELAPSARGGRVLTWAIVASGVILAVGLPLALFLK